MSKSIAGGGAQNDGFVGDVVTSMLTEAQFQAQRNSTWVLMDGRNVTGSRYQAITGNSSIPDARGVFLRGKNNGRSDGAQNPDGELGLGTYQADRFASHSHTTYISVSNGDDGDPGPYLIQDSVEYAGDKPYSATYTGGNETRSKNITVNYFIKIN